MGYLLVMSLSGTVMTGICALIRGRGKHKISARTAYLLDKAALLYYLAPLTELGDRYSRRLMYASGIGSRHVHSFSPRWSYYWVRANGKLYTNLYTKIQCMAVAIWILGVMFVFLAELLAHRRRRKRLEHCMNMAKISAETCRIRRDGRFCHIQQKVTVYRYVPDGKDMTFGLFRPIILCAQKDGRKQEEYVLQHELVHVRRADIFWKLLLRLAVILHWWNPAVWYLYHDFEWQCECSCDEVVLQGKTTKEKKEYLRLVVMGAVKDGKAKPENSRWGLGFELREGGRRIKERIENAMRTKKWNGVAAMLLVIVLVMVNSVTVLAYPKVHTEIRKEEVSEETIEMELNGEFYNFVPDNASEEEKKKDPWYAIVHIEVRYEEQFMDLDGNIFPINEIANENLYSGCSHTYVSGTVQVHSKNTDGSCTLSIYAAEKCSKCGKVVTGNRLHALYSDICMH